MPKTEWNVLEEVASSKPGRHFRVQCPECNRCRILSTSVINSKRSNCACQRKNRFDPFLTAVIAEVPTRKRVSQWISEYPELSMSAVKTRYYTRDKQGYTEEQILFGAGGFKLKTQKREDAVVIKDIDVELDQVSTLLVNAVDETIRRFFNKGGANGILDLAKTALRHNPIPEPITTFIGENYVTDMGVSLKDLVNSGSFTDAVEILKLDKFTNLQHKYKRLREFIHVDIESYHSLSHVEITQLFSLHRCMPDDE